MAITTTANKSLIKVTVGTESGTWGPYVNANEDLLDNMLGGTATIALTNVPVLLSSAQYQCNFIRFTGAITADVTVSLPSVGSFYTIVNDTTNSSTFCVTLATTTAGSQAIGLPPGALTDVMTDGANVRFRALPHVGAYWDYSGSSVPRWVNTCTIPPYLNCDGTAFSSVTYPHLANALGGTTLPDLRGRLRATLNQGTGRMTAAGGGVDGNTILAGGGVQSITLSSQNIPSYALPVTDPGHFHGYNPPNFSIGNPGGVGLSVFSAAGSSGVTSTKNTGITVDSGGSGVAIQPLPPLAIGGITMVRSA